MISASATEVKNNFGRFLQMVEEGEEVIVLRKGKEIARLVSHDSSVSFLTDALTGVLSGDYDDKEIRKERLNKYESLD